MATMLPHFMRITSLTRAVEIGANSYYLEAGRSKVLLDCGLHPRAEALDALPQFNLVPDRELDAVLITHAHQDHVGSLPALHRRQPQAPAFMTGQTADIADIMLHNSVNVMVRRREAEGIPEYPLFTHREASESASRWRACPLGQRISLEGGRLRRKEPADFAFEFFPSGHILGSVGIRIEADGKRLFYTGDVNFEDQTLSQGATFPDGDIDILIMECTRGDSPGPEGFTRRAEEDRFAVALEKAFERGGCAFIPVFALGKSQEILLLIHRLRREGKISIHPVYIGGLSTKITNAHDKHASSWPRQHPGLSLFDAVGPMTINGRNMDDAPTHKPRVYALSSGMMTEKTVSNTFARKVLAEPESTLMFVGYTDPASPAGIIRRAAHGDRITLDPDLPAVPLHCHREDFNFSAHATRESLRAYAARVRPKKILLVHGDPGAVEWFRGALAADLPECKITVPHPGQPVDL